MTRELTALSAADGAAIQDVINSAAEAYDGAIPPESYSEPYMAITELEGELEEMDFYGERRDRLVGVVGLQERPSVSLIRHLSVRPAVQRQGVGTALLELALERADSGTVLVGTWAAAEWAIAFY